MAAAPSEATLRETVAAAATEAAQWQQQSGRKRARGGTPASYRIICDGVVAQHELALQLALQGRLLESDAHLRALGMKYRLSANVLSPTRTESTKEQRAESSLEMCDTLAPPCHHAILLDDVLSAELLTALEGSLGPSSAFWSDHQYPTDSFFSYLHRLDREPRLIIEQAAAFLLPLVQEHAANLVSRLGASSSASVAASTAAVKSETCKDVSATGSARRKKSRKGSASACTTTETCGAGGGVALEAAEWWVHTRCTGEGHQMHYDLDESRLASHGEVRHPLISSVLYLGDEESLAEAPPTVVSTQRVGRRTTSASAPPKASSSSSSSSLALATAQEAAETALGADAHLAWPKRNRLLLFDGSRLHGVVPAARENKVHFGGGIGGGDGDDGSGGGDSGVTSPLNRARGNRLTLMIGWWPRGCVPESRDTAQIASGCTPASFDVLGRALGPCMELPEVGKAEDRGSRKTNTAKGNGDCVQVGRGGDGDGGGGAKAAGTGDYESDPPRKRRRRETQRRTPLRWMSELAAIQTGCPTAATRPKRASLQYAGRLWESVQQSSHPVPTAALKTGKSSAAGSHAKRIKSSPADANDGRVPGEQAIGAKALGANKNGANKRGVAENGVNANGHDEPPLLLPLLGPGAVELRSSFFLRDLTQTEPIQDSMPSRAGNLDGNDGNRMSAKENHGGLMRGAHDDHDHDEDDDDDEMDLSEALTLAEKQRSGRAPPLGASLPSPSQSAAGAPKAAKNKAGRGKKVATSQLAPKTEGKTVEQKVGFTAGQVRERQVGKAGAKKVAKNVRAGAAAKPKKRSE